jgi:hypothetical protein
LYQELPMNTFIRLPAVVLCLGVLALGDVCFDPACPLAYPAPWDPDRRDSLAESLTRNEQLEQLRESSFPGVEDNWQIAEEVIARRRGLAEAIEQFRDLVRQWPDVRAGTKKPELPWMSEDEWDGWAVIHRVRQVLADRPDEAAAVAGRLEQELRELLADRTRRRPAPAEGSR